jgi:hypothetical protein
MEYVSNMGINGFVVSTHPQLKELVNYIDDNTDLLKKMRFFPILPYAQGYVSKVTEKGIVGALNDILAGSTMLDKLKILYKGSIGFITKDSDKLLETIIDIELLPLHKTKNDTVFLHNIVTDLAISLGMKEVIETFFDHVKSKYGTNVGLVTKNFPKVVSVLKEWDLKMPSIMTSFNSIGYQMNPSREECEKCLAENDLRVIAMNTLAGGYLKPQEAAEYTSKLNLDYITIGMSTKEHADETIKLFQK